MTSFYLDHGECTISKEGLEKSASNLIPKNNVLISTRVGVGKVSVNRIDVAINQDLTGLILDKTRITPEFFVWTLLSKEYNQKLKGMSRGTTIKGLIRSELERFVIPLPPILEQRQIAIILSTVDNAIQRSQQAITETERLKAGVMQELMTKGIGHTEFNDDPDVGRVPKKWEVVRLISVLSEKTKYGYSGKEVNTGSKVRVLTLSAVTNNEISIKNTKECSHDPTQISDYWIKKDDIFIGRSNTRNLVGLTAIYKGNDPFAIFADLLIRVRADKSRILPDFLNYYLVSNYVRGYFGATSKGTSGSMKKIDTTIIEELKIRLPSPQEQQKIVKVISTIDRKITLQRKRRSHLEQFKQGLMNELLTGKRRVKVT